MAARVGWAIRQKLNADAAYERNAAAVKRQARDEYLPLFDGTSDWGLRIERQTAKAVKFIGIGWLPHSAIRGWREGYPQPLPWNGLRIGDRVEVAAWVKRDAR